MDFYERMKQVMAKGLQSTRKGMEQATAKAKELGEKGILRYEITRLESEVERKFAMLGGSVYRILSEKGQGSISQGTPEVKELLAELKDLQKRIEDKEKALSDVGRG